MSRFYQPLVENYPVFYWSACIMDPVYFQVSKSCMIHMNNYAQASRFILDQRKIHSDSEQNIWLLLRSLQASRTLVWDCNKKKYQMCWWHRSNRPRNKMLNPIFKNLSSEESYNGRTQEKSYFKLAWTANIKSWSLHNSTSIFSSLKKCGLWNK